MNTIAGPGVTIITTPASMSIAPITIRKMRLPAEGVCVCRLYNRARPSPPEA